TGCGGRLPHGRPTPAQSHRRPRLERAAPHPRPGLLTTIGDVNELVSLADIRAAAAELEAVVRRTPLEPSRDPALPGVHLKCENLQRAGSFKIRGAYMRLSHLGPAQRERGVVAASAGNHAQGVALAAATLGTHATVFM